MDTSWPTTSTPLPPEVRFDSYSSAEFSWLDPPDSVPPFHSFTHVAPESDRQSITVDSPALTGRAAVVAQTFNRRLGSARSCVGFTSCAAWPSDMIGPVFIEVIP